GEVDRSTEPARIELGEIDELEEDSAELSRLAFDLEVYDDEVIMCSFYSDGFEKVLVQDVDSFEADYVEEVEDEESLLERVLEVVEDRDPDILLGYNTDEFDFDVLRDRAERHGLELEMGRTGKEMRFMQRGRFSAA
ncbi:MAG: 3'-5' exonuclease, partial [Candidatus Nanohaloarchaea archaeon]|nr:3'-5' exonuclease [Candidatus Nanohaloarchaea archaeon]